MTRSGSLFRRALGQFAEDHGTLLAAAIAFYVLFSFLPLVTLTLAVLGFVMRDPASQQGAVDHVLQMLPLQSGPGQNLILDSVRGLAKESPGLTVIGLLGLLWSASGMFGAIRSALNIAWGAEPRHGLIGQKLADIAAVFGLGLLLLLSMTASIAVHLVQGYSLRFGGGGLVPLDRLWLVIGLVAPALISYVSFLLLYRNVPNVKHRASDVWPGALVAAVLFELGKHAFAFYVAHFNRYQQVNGALGGVMLFMLWTYVASIIMLFGAEFASEYENRRHEREAVETPPRFGYAARGARS